jgi:DNA-binding transcriptional MocR family regulator
MLIKINRQGDRPLHQQIDDQVARLIDDGSLQTGARLPPTRVLARQLGINRSTVTRAYQELWARGYLEARPGSYSTVRGRLRPAHAATDDGPGLLDWRRLSTVGAEQAVEDMARLTQASFSADGASVVDFSKLSADRSLCPVDAIKGALRWVIGKRGQALFDYGEPAGYRPLRETIARAMRVHGVAITPDEVLITNGSQHGLDLLMRMLGRPGTAAVLESPSYAMALALSRHHGIPVNGIPMRADGMDLKQLERRLARGKVAFVYTMPNFQNPTGITTTQAHRETILALCETHRVPIIEDGFEEELKYFGNAVLPIKSMDSHGTVIYLGTFSKVVFPGLRVGWIAAHRDCISRLLAVSRVSWLSGNILTQAAVSRFFDDGSYEEHVRRVHRTYRRRMQTLLQSLKAYLPATGVQWSEPAGGYTLLLRLHRPLPEARLVEQLRHAGVLVSPGSIYFAKPTERPSFRLSIANLTEEQIQEGCRRLGRLLHEVMGK